MQMNTNHTHTPPPVLLARTLVGLATLLACCTGGCLMGFEEAV